MTKKEFRRAMLCGLGKCIIELKSTDDRMKYYDDVMWACRHVLSYEPPSEGTRGYYIWQMASCFDDASPFLAAVLEGFKSAPSNRGWKFAHYCSILVYFALEGSEEARAAMEEKYLSMYLEISRRRNLAAAICSPLGEDFERLCVELIRGGTDAYVRIAHDIGKLYAESRRRTPWNFGRLSDFAEETFGKRIVDAALKKAARTDPAVAMYVDVKECDEDFFDEEPEPEEYDTDVSDEDFPASPAALDWSLVCEYIERGGEAAAARYAEAALAAKNDKRKAMMLSALRFAWPKWPLSAEALAEQAKREKSPEVRDAMFQILKEVKTEPARLFAREVLEVGEDSEEKSDAIAVLLKNYAPQDKELLLTAVRSLPVNTREEGWHDVVSTIVASFQAGNPSELPNELLTYVYENSLCSFCRAYAVKSMAKRRMLTDELLQECLYDCSKDVRALAARRLHAKAARK